MAFHLGRFLKETSIDSLRRYILERVLDWPEDFDWQSDPKTLQASMTKIMVNLNDRSSARIWRELAQVYSLCDEIGQETVINLVKSDGNLGSSIHSAADQYGRAFGLLLQNSSLFERTLDYAAMARGRKSRGWSSYNFAAPKNMPTEETIVSLLEEALPDILAERHGKKPRVEIDLTCMTTPGESNGGQTALNILVYVEGQMTGVQVFSDRGVKTDFICPVVRCSIVFDPEHGQLEVIAKGGKALHAKIARTFAQLISGEKDIDPIPLREFDLSPLQRALAFPFDVSDPIKEVWLEEIELHSIADSEPRHTIKRPARRGSPDAEWTRRGGVLGTPEHLIGNPLFKVYRVAIGVRFHPDVGERQAKPLMTTITMPNKCNLREHTERERLVLQKYLPRWGLVREVGGRSLPAV